MTILITRLYALLSCGNEVANSGKDGFLFLGALIAFLIGRYLFKIGHPFWGIIAGISVFILFWYLMAEVIRDGFAEALAVLFLIVFIIAVIYFLKKA